MVRAVVVLWVAAIVRPAWVRRIVTRRLRLTIDLASVQWTVRVCLLRLVLQVIVAVWALGFGLVAGVGSVLLVLVVLPVVVGRARPGQGWSDCSRGSAARPQGCR